MRREVAHGFKVLLRKTIGDITEVFITNGLAQEMVYIEHGIGANRYGLKIFGRKQLIVLLGGLGKCDAHPAVVLTKGFKFAQHASDRIWPANRPGETKHHAASHAVSYEGLVVGAKEIRFV